MGKNPNCDGERCTSEKGEVRILPIGGGANLILCRACFEAEIAYRKERNKELAPENRFDLPEWEALEVY